MTTKTKTWWSNHHVGGNHRDKCKIYPRKEDVHVNADIPRQSENVQNSFWSSRKNDPGRDNCLIKQ